MPNAYDYFFQNAPSNLSPAEVANQMAQGDNLRQMAALHQQEQLKNQMTLKSMAMQQAEDEATRRALAESINPDGTVNRQAAIAKLASNPQTAMTANKLYHQWMTEDIALNKSGNEAMKAGREARAAQLKATKDEAELIGQITSGVKDQATYDAAKQYAAGKGLDVSGFPAQYDPGLINQYRSRSMSVQHQSELELKKIDDQRQLEQLAETKRHNRAMEAKPNAMMLMMGAMGGQNAGASQLYAQRLLSGAEPWPSSLSLRTDPIVREGVQIARQMDPAFNASTHALRQETQKKFTTGKPAEVINALNTGMGHLAELSDLAEKLGNTSITPYNKVANILSKAKGDPTVAAFQTTKKAVADEVTRVWRGTGGSEKDIQEALSNLSEDLSPAQLRGNIYQLTKLMASKQKAMEDQYQKGMGRFGDLKVLNDEARQGLSKIQKRAGVKGGEPTDQSGGLPRINSPSDPAFQSLPSGARFIGPDGVERVKR